MQMHASSGGVMGCKWSLF